MILNAVGATKDMKRASALSCYLSFILSFLLYIFFGQRVVPKTSFISHFPETKTFFLHVISPPSCSLVLWSLLFLARFSYLCRLHSLRVSRTKHLLYRFDKTSSCYSNTLKYSLTSHHTPLHCTELVTRHG